MLATLRLAQRLRVTTLAAPLTRATMVPAPPVACGAAWQQRVAQCSGQGKQGRPSRGKVQLCEGEDQTPEKRPTSKDKGAAEGNGKEEPSYDCCGSAKGVQNAGSKPKAQGVCNESEDKFVKDTEDREEACETSEEESDQECSSEEEDARAPIKECPDEEDDTSSCSDEDEKPGKAVSEMCDCVKTAVAKAVEQKAKEVEKLPQQKTLGQPGPCKSTDKEPPKPKASEHVRCCSVEKGMNELSVGKAAGEKCREERKALDIARSLPQSGGQGSTPDTNKADTNNDAAKGDKKHQPCDCIKQALEKCKQGASTPKPPISRPKQPEKKKPDKKQPDSAGKKPSDKPNKKSDDKKPSKPNKNKPDPKKPAAKSKHCEKKKKPVVICK